MDNQNIRSEMERRRITFHKNRKNKNELTHNRIRENSFNKCFLFFQWSKNQISIYNFCNNFKHNWMQF